MNRRPEPPTWGMIEAALLNGRLRPWVDTVPGFWSMTAGEQALNALQLLQRFLPTAVEADALEALGLFPGAIDVLLVHLIEHLRTGQPLKEPCSICKPLVGLRVGLDGVGKIRVWQTDVNADVKIQPGDRSVAWRCATCSSPASLQRLKEIILKGDQLQAEINRRRAAAGGGG
jgi:hypothetical protein